MPPDKKLLFFSLKRIAQTTNSVFFLSGGQLLFRRRDNLLIILTFVAMLRRGEKLSPVVVRVQKCTKARKNKKLKIVVLCVEESS